MPSRFDEFRDAIEGAVCHGLVAQAYGYHGVLVTRVTVVYLAFAERRWARFGIDGGHFHWRETSHVEPIAGDGSGYVYPLWELAAVAPVVGHRVREVSLARTSPGGATLTIDFAGRGALALVNADDHSRVEFREAAG